MVIEEALAPLLEDYALQLFVRSLGEQVDCEDPGDLVSVVVDGADHPGTVARIARAIAECGGTIVDLVGHVILEGGTTPSQLRLTASVERAAAPALRRRLDGLAEELGMRCEFRHGD
jgi:predicted amino acid-binding ACT domain protein